MGIFQLQNRQEIRESIGYNLNDMMLVTNTTTGDKNTLIATYSLAKGGDDEYNGRQLICVTPTGSIAAGEKSWVSDFAIATYEATCAPDFSANITDGDIFEMWKVFTYEEINEAINQAIIKATSTTLIDRQTDSNFTLSGIYEYSWLVPYAFGNDFRGLHRVEYVSNIGNVFTIHNCESAWDELVDGDVTASTDTTYNIEGNYALKLVVAAGCGANDILATQDISELDISSCDKVEIFIRSSTALDAGDIQLLLDDTAQCASAVESLDIPATLANTNTYHVIDLANPHSDTAIISVGLKMVTDKGAFTLYADRIRAVDSGSKVYDPLSPDHWSIVRGTTPKFKLTESGLSVVGADTQVRLTGYAAPDIFSDDSTDSEIDPAYLIASVTGTLLISHAKSNRLDIKDKASLSKYWLGEAENRLRQAATDIAFNIRWTS